MAHVQFVARPLISALVLSLLALLLPATAFACLPYDPPDNFSFRRGVDFAYVGHVVRILEDQDPDLIQPRIGVVIRVERTLLGPERGRLVIGPDHRGGCARPAGEIGDVILIAHPRSAPAQGLAGPTRPSPYDSAVWVIRQDRVVFGPDLRGMRPGNLTALIVRLLASPDAAMLPPRLPWTPLGLTVLAAAGLLAFTSILRTRRRTTFTRPSGMSRSPTR